MRTSFLHKPQQQLRQPPKIKCVFHPQQYLTNFCNAQGCLLPLCPSCISIHVNQHLHMHSNPHFLNINQAMKGLYGQLGTHGHTCSQLHKQFVHIQAKVENVRSNIRRSLQDLKQDAILTVQKMFRQIQTQTLSRFNQLQYVRNLAKYKQLSKRTVLALKTCQRNFFADDKKVMRMLIKYEANNLKELLEKFCYQSKHFANMYHENFISFHLNDITDSLNLQNLSQNIKVNLVEEVGSIQPRDLTAKLKQLYEKPMQKAEIKKSLHKMLSHKNTPIKNNTQIHEHSSSKLAVVAEFSERQCINKDMPISYFRPQLSQVPPRSNTVAGMKSSKIQSNYESVKDSIIQATNDLNTSLHRRVHVQSVIKNHRQRTSSSKGKGISVMQSSPVADLKRQHQFSTLGCEMDLRLLNGRSQQVGRRYR